MNFPSSCAKGCGRGRRRSCIAATSATLGRIPRIRSVQVQEGMIDPVAGRSYAEISFEGRSQHKTQAQGGIEPRGPIASTLTLADSLVQAPRPRKPIFDGIDTTVPVSPGWPVFPKERFARSSPRWTLRRRRRLRTTSALEPARIIPALADGLRATRAARAAVKSAGGTADARADADFLLAFKETEFTDALVRAAEVDADPLASQETVVQGETVDVLVRTFVPAGSTVAIQKAIVNAPAGWRIEPVPPTRAPRTPAASGRRETPTNVVSYRLHVPADAPVTEPYYLKQRRTGDTYRWMDGDPKSLPFDPPLITASVALTIGGIDVTVSRPVQFRYADAVRGELRRDVNIVPRVAVGLDTPLLVVAARQHGESAETGRARDQLFAETSHRHVAASSSAGLDVHAGAGVVHAERQRRQDVNALRRHGARAARRRPPRHRR